MDGMYFWVEDHHAIIGPEHHLVLFMLTCRSATMRLNFLILTYHWTSGDHRYIFQPEEKYMWATVAPAEHFHVGWGKDPSVRAKSLFLELQSTNRRRAETQWRQTNANKSEQRPKSVVQTWAENQSRYSGRRVINQNPNHRMKREKPGEVAGGSRPGTKHSGWGGTWHPTRREKKTRCFYTVSINQTDGVLWGSGEAEQEATGCSWMDVRPAVCVAPDNPTWSIL